MEKEAQLHYNTFLESGDLEALFPKAKGEWEKDKKWYMSYYKDQRRIMEDLNIEDTF